MSIPDNLTEVPNIYPPPDITKRHIHARERGIISTIRNQAYSVCRTQIADSYIHMAFNTFKNGFVYFKDAQPISFCIWKARSNMGKSGEYDPDIYIYLICSIKQPFRMLDMILYDVDNFCKEKGIRSMVLEPANEELRDYYRTKGFADLPPSNRDMYRKVETTVIFRPPEDRTRRTRRTKQLTNLD